MLTEEERSRINVTALFTGVSLDGLVKMINGETEAQSEFEPIEVVNVVDDNKAGPTLVLLEEQTPPEFMKGSGAVSYDNLEEIARLWGVNAKALLWTDRLNFKVDCEEVATRMCEMLGDKEYIIMGHSAFVNVAVTASDMLLKSGRKVSKLLVADPCHIPKYGPGFINFADKLKSDPELSNIVPPSDLWRTYMLSNSGDLPKVEVPVVALMATERGAKWEPVERSVLKLQSLCSELSILYVPSDHLDVFRDEDVYEQLSSQVQQEMKPRQATIRLRFW
jgi:hypothetical protein